jgi:hypothetical protein
VDCRVIETTGSKLVVITIRFDQKQVIDAASAMLSLPPKQRSNDSDHEYMFITMPACVIEHAFPVEAAIFVEVSIEVLVVDSCHVVSLITSGTDIVSISPQKCLHLTQVRRLVSGHKPAPFCMLTTPESEPALLEVHEM